MVISKNNLAETNALCKELRSLILQHAHRPLVALVEKHDPSFMQCRSHLRSDNLLCINGDTNAGISASGGEGGSMVGDPATISSDRASHIDGSLKSSSAQHHLQNKMHPVATIGGDVLKSSSPKATTSSARLAKDVAYLSVASAAEEQAAGRSNYVSKWPDNRIGHLRSQSHRISTVDQQFGSPKLPKQAFHHANHQQHLSSAASSPRSAGLQSSSQASSNNAHHRTSRHARSQGKKEEDIRSASMHKLKSLRSKCTSSHISQALSLDELQQALRLFAGKDHVKGQQRGASKSAILSPQARCAEL